ncbi:MAG: GNAT family N-acetyltransferase, partial [Patescibacteria group bacterium]
DQFPKALYVHYLCVHRDFAGTGLPKLMIDFAAQKALENNIKLLRVDTNASMMKLRKIYEELGFTLVGIEQEDYRKTAFYQKKII